MENLEKTTKEVAHQTSEITSDNACAIIRELLAFIADNKKIDSTININIYITNFDSVTKSVVKFL